MKWKLALVLPLAFGLALFNSTCYGQVAAAESPAMEGFGRLLGGTDSGGSGTTDSSRGYGTLPNGQGGAVHAGMPITGVDPPGQPAPRSEPTQEGTGRPAPQSPPPAAPSQPDQVAPAQPSQRVPAQPEQGGQAKPGKNEQAKPGKSVQAKPGQGGAKKPVSEQGNNSKNSKQMDLAQLINGSWRVKFSTGAATTMTWRYDPQRNSFFDGAVEYTVQLSGNVLHMRGTSPFNGMQIRFTLQFKNATEAYGSMGFEGGPNRQAPTTPVQFQAVKVG